jgi:hypothetical protein|tara:strand:- start:1998 stop:2600 length:603 start_codon:yes stop_codon:yes gene_type:complete
MSIFLNSLMLFTGATKAWQRIANSEDNSVKIFLLHTVLLALIPPACWYYGVTHYGWTVGEQVMRITPASAAPMCVMFYFASVAGVLFLSAMVRWMSTTYASEVSLNRSLTLISYTATPFFFAGVIGVYPLLWLDIATGIFVAFYCIYLLYSGVSPIMRLNQQHSFLYASAVFALSLIMFVGLLTITVLFWEYAAHPEYTY